MNPSRRWLLGGVSVAAVGAGAGWAWWRTQPTSAADTVAFWASRFARPQGGELVIAELRGKPLLLNFWATWCPPCIKELPEFDRFHRAHAQRLHIVGLAIDKLEPVQDFLKRHPLGFDIGVAGMEGTELSRSLGNPAGVLPFTVLFAPDGRIVQRRVGESTYADLEAWTRSL